MTLNKVMIAILMMLVLVAPSKAQEQPFEPVMATFSGQGALIMPGAPALEIQGAGAIEFWVAAGWTIDPGYDPAIMAYTGDEGPRFAFHISGDRQSLGVFSGQFYENIAFNFADGNIHYVAINIIGDSMDIMIDGVGQATLGFGIANLPAVTFSVGSIGDFSPFIGRIGQVRIWDEPIDPDVLNYFSWRPIEAQGRNAHPDLESLVGISTFGNTETSGFLFVGEPDDANIAGPDLPPIIVDDGE